MILGRECKRPSSLFVFSFSVHDVDHLVRCDVLISFQGEVAKDLGEINIDLS